MHEIPTAGGEKFRTQGGQIMVGITSGGILVPIRVDADGNLATGGGTVAAAVTSVDGGIVSIGLKGDAAVTNPASSASEIALLKGLLNLLTNGGTVQTPNWAKVSATGSVAAGAKSITVVASSDFTGTVGGAEFLPDTSMTWRADIGHLLAALAYTRSAGSLYIGTVV